MTESFVAFGHPVGLLFALHRAAGVLRSIQNLERELLAHTLPAPLARETHDPAARERKPALRPDLDRHLVGRDDTLDGTVAARHQAAALPFSRFAPYFDRAFLRFLVPAVSSVPRMMW